MTTDETAGIVTPPADDWFVNGKHVLVRLGPYREQVLIMPAAEADQAIADGWAQEHAPAPLDANAPPPPPPQDPAAALAAAEAWAQEKAAGDKQPKQPKQPKQGEPEQPQPHRDEHTRRQEHRDMRPRDEPRGKYPTR